MVYGSAVLGGKQASRAPASLASHRPDLRRDISPWRALVWAYADEHVRAATHCGSEPVQYCSNGLRLMRLGETGIGRGTINGLLDAHPDAFAIDATVAAWFEEWPDWRNGVACYAEARRRPPPADRLPPWRITGPELNAKGRPREIWAAFGRKDYPVLCPLACEGHPPHEIARHRAFMDLFDGLLGILPGLRLQKWKIMPKPS